MRRAGLVIAIALVITGCLAPTAGATFPGRNGPIAYRPVDPETGLGTPLLQAQPDGTQVTLLTDLPGFFSDWRADGKRIAFDFFEPSGDEQIATMTADGRDLRVLTSGPGIHEVPSWSPNGRRIAFDFSPEADPSTPGFETRLWTMRADGSKPKPLPMDEPGFDVEPKYSPNGRWIAFARLRITSSGDEAAIFIVRANGGRVQQLTPWGAFVEHPTWSPDSRWITFNTPEGTIEAIRADGSERRTILQAVEGFGGHKPWFSPNGKRMLFVCENWGTLPEPPPDFNDDICVMDADGTDIVNLTNTTETFENWPSWGAAPRDHEDDDDDADDDD
jgi:dipeptidyl aminopeptidase/acylaminoacyl peptidase